ncbi:phosphatase PAP2 family protein [Spiroplasma chinense]|uniref:Phosphatase PAP2 family protein n=1 Tax=Spiroplasma chinense TaxID=216932 RepID=A0A5B9Y3F6_9MOLU|nr:phosphatase PAP2 family protein [Spiroplasma chinense]QEH61531.1 phosphatase PAP2 family protein [Spiroplasma chinense]
MFENKKKTKWYLIGILYTIIFAAFVTFIFKDYLISKLVVENMANKSDWLKHSFDMYGVIIYIIPIYTIIFYATLYLFNLKKVSSKWVISIETIISIISLVIIILASMEFEWFKTKNEQNSIEIISALIWYFIVLAYMVCLQSFTYKEKLHTNKEFLNEIIVKTIYAAIMVALAMLSVEILKNIFGRPRPREIFATEDPKSLFKYAFEINFTKTRSKSFPSGHTTSAATMLAMLFFIDFNKNKTQYLLLFIVSWVGIILTAISRIMILAHFATDVTFAIMMSGAYFLAAKPIGDKIIQRIQKRGEKQNG